MSLKENPIFVQLNLLEYGNDQNFWREKSRWIRFEEAAEEVPGRWSKPHVSTLTHSSIEEVLNLLNEGKIILDVDLNQLNKIAGY